MTEKEMVAAIAVAFGSEVAAWADRNAAGWVLEAMADPRTGKAFLAAHPFLAKKVSSPVSFAAARRSARLRAGF